MLHSGFEYLNICPTSASPPTAKTSTLLLELYFLLPYLISDIFNRIIRHYLVLCLVSLNFIRYIENVNRSHGDIGTVIREVQDCNDSSYG